MELGSKPVLERILKATIKKISNSLYEEYLKVEDSGPAPGDAWGQHDAMVARGLCAAAVKYPEKNRYCNLFPFDAGRYILTARPGLEHDYINASWVRLPSLPQPFILTMAPLLSDSKDRTSVSTCRDFWQMVEETGANLLLMLCRVEPGFAGCSQYFPPSTSTVQTYGDYTVTGVDQVEGEAAVERTLDLAWGQGRRRVQHLQFNVWPNYGVVEDISHLADLVKKVYSMNKETCSPLVDSMNRETCSPLVDSMNRETCSPLVDSMNRETCTPLVVHCSGGIGRSGTFVAVFYVYSLLLKYLQTGDEGCLSDILDEDNGLSLVKVVKCLREQRHPWMVEGEKQYFLAYRTILHLLQEFINQ